jgi:hypothetical protein
MGILGQLRSARMILLVAFLFGMVLAISVQNSAVPARAANPVHAGAVSVILATATSSRCQIAPCHGNGTATPESSRCSVAPCHDRVCRLAPCRSRDTVAPVQP